MTTSNVNVGFLSDDRNSSKVLKPPGGETHDIFGQNVAGGAAGDHSSSSSSSNQRGRNRGHLQSNIFDDGHDQPAAGRSANGNAGAAANGNVNRIFGNGSMEAPEGTPARKVKDYHKSNIFGIGDDHEAMNANLNTSHRRPNANNHGYGNPITGEGYANGSAKLENGNVGSRGRNPPGGHATNLW